uniref:Odorant receptor n=1 Tax=Heliconius charithonia charithonia TaxID=3062107 RepID=A0AA49J6C7_HELCH|nr:olfactory receptor 28 [Heliconius charithonia charithonia]
MDTEIDVDKSEKKFKCFNETFPHCTFALAFSLTYPNPTNIKKRLIIFSIAILLNSGMLIWFILYLFKCIQTRDLYNLARNITIGVLVLLFFSKMYYTTRNAKKFARLLEKITDDLLQGNDLAEEYQIIYEYYIKIGKHGETIWIIIPILLSSQFPIYAGVCNMYESLRSDVGKKYMIHEMELKYIEDIQYETPYYEMLFAYNIINVILLSPNFAGFDGSFCIATNHLRLKLKVLAHKVCAAFRGAKSKADLKEKLKSAIRDHQEALDFYDDLQEVYGGWLLVVFLLTSFLISLNIYQIYLSQQIDTKYSMFAISGIIHMFTPCYFSSNLIKTSEELSWDLYNAAWEDWPDPAVRKLLIFMITKSQQTLVLTGQGMVYFNMQLFISVLQTSYSVFTLITS